MYGGPIGTIIDFVFAGKNTVFDKNLPWCYVWKQTVAFFDKRIGIWKNPFQIPGSDRRFPM